MPNSCNVVISAKNAVEIAEKKKPVAISRHASDDPRFKFFNNLKEDKYEAFLSVPITLKGDLVGVIDALQAEQAILIGHDWGAPIVWQTALVQRARVRAVVGLRGGGVAAGGVLAVEEGAAAGGSEIAILATHA